MRVCIIKCVKVGFIFENLLIIYTIFVKILSVNQKDKRQAIGLVVDGGCSAYVFIYMSCICVHLYVLHMSLFICPAYVSICMSCTCLCLHHVVMKGVVSCMCLHLHVVVEYAVFCICLHLHILHMSPFIYPVYVSVHM